LLKKRVNQAWANVFFYSFLESADYAIPMRWPLVQYGEYVEAGEVAD
jgi:hypothetical protein